MNADMTITDIIKQLTDLAKDRESFFRDDGDDEVFRHDYDALIAAVEILARVGIVTAELERYQQAEREGRLQIVDKELFCRKAAKRAGKCAGYSENMFTRKTLAMCAICDAYNENDDWEEFDDDDSSDC